MITFARNKNCYKDPGFLKGLKSNWLLGDHLGSTSMVADASGTMVSEMRYSAFGETRYENGAMTTDHRYTGQRQEVEIGLYYYVARWYDPGIGRFIQADIFIPNAASAKNYNRYAYVADNPLKYTDPNGHMYLAEENWGKIYKTWINVSYPSSLLPNTFESQYRIKDPTGVLLPKHKDRNNLCGQIVLSLIYETEFSNIKYSAYDIWKDGTNSTGDSTAGLDLLKAINKVFSEVDSWVAVHSTLNVHNDLLNGEISTNNEYGDNYWWRDENNNNIAYEIIHDSVKAGNYVIVLASVDSVDTGRLTDDGNRDHWVLVTSVSEKYVQVYNPFNSSFERYSKEFFMDSITENDGTAKTIIDINYSGGE